MPVALGVAKAYKAHVMVFLTSTTAYKEYNETAPLKIRLWHRKEAPQAIDHIEALLDVLQLAQYYRQPKFLDHDYNALEAQVPETDSEFERQDDQRLVDTFP